MIIITCVSWGRIFVTNCSSIIVIFSINGIQSPGPLIGLSVQIKNVNPRTHPKWAWSLEERCVLISCASKIYQYLFKKEFFPLKMWHAYKSLASWHKCHLNITNNHISIPPICPCPFASFDQIIEMTFVVRLNRTKCIIWITVFLCRWTYWARKP